MLFEEDMYDNSGNESINCIVVGCSYNNEKGKCTLENIQVGSTSNNRYCNSTDTICNSFCPSKNYLDYEIAEEILDDLND